MCARGANHVSGQAPSRSSSWSGQLESVAGASNFNIMLEHLFDFYLTFEG